MLTKAQVKYIQSLGHKKLRDSEDVFVAEGPKLVNELLNADNVKPVAIYATEGFAGKHARLKQLVRITEHDLERISSLSAPNEVLGIFSKPVFGQPVWRSTISLMLDGIQDPGNLGAIIRTADWFAVRTIICSRDCADNFNSKVVQATMGSLTRVQLIYTDLVPFIQNNPLPGLYAATLDGKDLYQLGKVKEGIFIIGNESKGISKEVLAAAQHRITIPRRGGAESLNAAVATGIILSRVALSQ